MHLENQLTGRLLCKTVCPSGGGGLPYTPFARVARIGRADPPWQEDKP
jgi:hypothetical protein